MPRWSPVVVSFSELDAFRQCPHKHDLSYKQRWSPATVSRALSIGKLWHLVMENHYRAVQAGATDLARREAIALLLLEAAETNQEYADLVAWMYDGYEEMWGTDPDWEIVGVEEQHLVRLPALSGRPGRFGRYWLRMRADLIVRVRSIRKDRLWLVDHKSGKNLPTDKELEIDDQFGLYTWALQKDGLPIFGSIHGASRTERLVREMTLEERFRRTPMYRTDQELRRVAQEAAVTARTAYVTYSDGDAPRAPDSDRCRWRCPFTEACLLGRKTGDRNEQEFLGSSGFLQLTETEQLAQRGYGDEVLQPGEPKP